jgi:predicted  nucleic acid-binding Zn-ribbon protein
VADLHRLLDVQDHDLALDQLRHRRESLPDRLALAEQEATVARIGTELGELEARLRDLQVTQKRLEDEIETIETKAAAESKKLNSGTITAPRELQSLNDEVEALGRRQRQLEDELLDVLEPAEELGVEIDRLGQQRDLVAAQADEIRGRILVQEAEIDAAAEKARGERDAAASELDAPLLERYEKLRARLGGIAVARLEGAQCTGCHVALPAMELDQVRHAAPDAIVVHEDCGRILVR